MEIARDQLKSIVARVERLEAEIKALNDDKSDIYKEARANGFDVKAIKKVVSQRKLDSNERQEADIVFETYWNAVHGINLVHARVHGNIEEFDAETGEILSPASDDTPIVPPSQAVREVEESTAIQSRANVEEEYADKSAASSDDPASRASEESERQRASMVGFADDCRTGGKEQSDASAAPVGDAAAYAHGIPDTFSENDAVAAVATALPSAERVTPADMGSAAANAGGDHVTVQTSSAATAGAAFSAAPAINERCLDQAACKFSHHPNKITCSSCSKAWYERKVAVPA